MFRMFFLCLALAGLFAVTATAADLTIVNVPSALETQVFGLNNQGDIAGVYKDAAGKQHGFLMSKGVLYLPDRRTGGRHNRYSDLGHQ